MWMVVHQTYLVLSSPTLSVLVKMWLQNNIHFSVVEGTLDKQRNFRSEMNHYIPHLKVLQRKPSSGAGALASTYCIRTLCLPLTSFLLLWLHNDIHFAVVEGTPFLGLFDV